MPLNKITSKLEELFGIDLRALALMRIAFSICILIDLADRLPHIKVLYSDEGVLPGTYAIHALNPHAICLNLMSGSWVFQALLFFLTMCFTMGLLLGWRTQLCTFAVWVLISSLDNRNYFVLGMEEKLLNVLLFWCIFLPWGACYSLDSRRDPHTPLMPRVTSMASLGYLLQISFFYTFAGFLKTGSLWASGSALYYVLNMHIYVKPFGRLLLQHPFLIHHLSISIPWIERYGAFFFFIPFKNLYFRLLSIASFMLLHIGIFLSMETSLFQWVCLIMLIGFLPTPFLNKILKPLTLAEGGAMPVLGPSWKPNLFFLPFYMSLVLAFFIVYIFFWNIGELKSTPFSVPQSWKWIGYSLNIDQHWGMFAPNPSNYDGWCVVPGKLRNGKIVDIINGGKSLNWREPASIQKRNGAYQLSGYCKILQWPKYFYYRKPWAEYLCREWNSQHPFDQQLLFFDIDSVERDIQLDDQKPLPHLVLLISHECSGPNKEPTISIFSQSQANALDNPYAGF